MSPTRQQCFLMLPAVGLLFLLYGVTALGQSCGQDNPDCAALDDNTAFMQLANQKAGGSLSDSLSGRRRRRRKWKRDKAQSVSMLFYRPHFDCGNAHAKNSSGNVTHARQWLEDIMDTKNPDFIGLSEMEYKSGLPGETRGKYGSYKVIGAVCNTTFATIADPIGLYYDSDKWNLMDSYPPSKQCRKYPKVQYGKYFDPWVCAAGKATASEDDCCSCTNTDRLAVDQPYPGIYDDNGQAYDTYQNFQGSRPFVLGTFQNRESDRMVCVVTFNLPHPLLQGCTTTADSLCFGNIDFTASRPGTAQMVRVINDMCGEMPLLFAGDTNNAAPEYETSFMFENPNTPDTVNCQTESTLPYLQDPAAKVFLQKDESGSPYTCCADYPKDGGEVQNNMFASDRVAASGKISKKQDFFTPVKLFGGTAEADTTNPGNNGLPVKYCPGVDSAGYDPIQGYPCCGADEEHSPVMGKFELYR